MPSNLTKKHCKPCEGGVEPLGGDEIERLRRELGGGWVVVEGHHLEKEYAFEDFRGALAFTHRVGEVAESEGHHPDIHLGWGKVRLTIWTHAVGGLTENDFILAARADDVL